MWTNEDRTIFTMTKTDVCCIEIPDEEFERIVNENCNKGTLNDPNLTLKQKKDLALDILKIRFIPYFEKSDIDIIRKQKQTLNGLWDDVKEEEFNRKMEEYKQLYTKYSLLKNRIINARKVGDIDKALSEIGGETWP